jgi:hypothetical protein
MDALEFHQLALVKDTDTKFEKIFSELADKNNRKPSQGVFLMGKYLTLTDLSAILCAKLSNPLS